MKEKSQADILIKWYNANKRDLPWRKSKDPYKIWISEVMLQQTTVKVVIPYFERFVKKFPDFKTLAKANEDDVLALWTGLGYYSRAQNLKQAAQQILNLGEFPKTFSALLELRGIGPYTAAAVASIAFDERVACVDGNVMRVISRLYDLDGDITKKPNQEKIRELATGLMGNSRPSEFNQALMELGATVCVPQNPGCLVCPLSATCLSLNHGTVSLRPVKLKKQSLEPWLWQLNLLEKKGKIAIVKNDVATPWLKNAWVFPGVARRLNSTKPKKWDLKHAITKHNIYVVLKNAKTPSKGNKLKWVSLQELEALGVSSIVWKVLGLPRAQKILKIKGRNL